MAKKITIFLAFAFAALAMFLGGFLISKRSLTGNQNQQALIDNSLVSRFQETTEKRVSPVGLFAISRDRAAFPSLSASGKEILFYNPENGEIRSVPVQNISDSSALVAKIKSGARQISWGPNKTLVAVYSDGSIFYDLNSNFSKKLDSKIKSPVLSRTGDKLVYNYFDPKTGEGNISISDPTAEIFKTIMPTRLENWQIGWVSNSVLSLIKRPASENQISSLFTLNVETKSLKNILDFKSNLEVVWSPNGQKILYSYGNSSIQESSLYFMDLANQEEIELDVDLSASKCVWSIDNKTVYCAGKDLFFTVDTSAAQPIAKNITTLATEAQSSSATATDLLLTSSEDYLVFKNSQNGKLYGLSLGIR